MIYHFLIYTAPRYGIKAKSQQRRETTIYNFCEKRKGHRKSLVSLSI